MLTVVGVLGIAYSYLPGIRKEASVEFTRSELEDRTRRQERNSLLLSIICDCDSVVFVNDICHYGYLVSSLDVPPFFLHFSSHSHRTSICCCVTFGNVPKVGIKFTLHVCNALTSFCGLNLSAYKMY